MSKELDALENIKHYDSRVGLHESDYNIIETALKDYENLKLKHRSMQDAVLDDFKKLKALEIIKEKRVNVQELYYSDNVEEYNEHISHSEKPLTQAEFDLLKEVLL